MKFIIAIAFMAMAAASVDGLKILGIFPTCGSSHFYVGEGIMKSLLSAGHEITMISPFPQKKLVANWTDIDIPGLMEQWNANQKGMNVFSMKKFIVGPVTSIMLSKFVTDLTGNVLDSPTLEPLYHKIVDFDLVICEMFDTEALIGFGQHFEAPVIVVATAGSSKWTNDLVGTPQPTSYVPNLLLSFTDNMTTLQRIGNFLMGIFEDFLVAVYHTPRQRNLYNKHFPNARLTYDEALKNVSLAFINTHISLSTPKPYAPNMIEIGGINIDRNSKPLPKELDEFISSAKDGVIYFSMGSQVKSSQLPQAALSAIINSVKKLKQKVLWKLDDPSVVKEKISNLYISKWFPQNDILAHPNVVLFISHGGLLSTTESVFHGKPILGMPVFGDQELNIAKAVYMGWALRLDCENINEEDFYGSIMEMVTNPKYRDNVKRVSQIYKDQPMTPQELVVYWTEYVARYHGAPYMHSKIVDMSYIKRYNIDVIIYLTIVIIITCKLMYYLFITCCCKRKATKSKVKTK